MKELKMNKTQQKIYREAAKKAEEISVLQWSRIIEQTSFAYSQFGVTCEKQTKTTENQGENYRKVTGEQRAKNERAVEEKWSVKRIVNNF